MARSTSGPAAPGSEQEAPQVAGRRPGGAVQDADTRATGHATAEASGRAAAGASGASARAGERTGVPEQRQERATASYIYGILPSDVELTPEPRGVGDPPGEIALVRHRDIAALVSELRLTRPLGRPQDLVAHQNLLDDVAAEVPVLPLRFGAVMESPEAIVSELLTPHHDRFRSALEELEGRVQFVVKGRYEEGTVLREVLAEEPEAARLREEIRGLPEEATWDARIRLGEIINRAVEVKRDADTQVLAQGLAPHAVAVVIREPTHEEDAAHLAVLVETDRQEEFERALEEFGRRWADRVTLRLLGPQAPYDFVDTQG
ncbi:GvpL/GvpF family gas vesicle protein [Sphaerisporangium rhizosphaerae]|uniref:GvpL/GvpF family gas vesicle protein n=1 Tax=Sphaerisporangium rhizosphaerae TaxID=2269375 RepID=A0ABW2PFZ6_9ACTN